MNVKEAVQTAKDYINAIYADEQVGGVGLEEVKFESGLPDTWDVTIGFFGHFPASQRVLSQRYKTTRDDACTRSFASMIRTDGS